MPSLREVPDRVLAALDRTDRGVVVLAVDGLAYTVAAEHWQPSTLDVLRSTVPSTSTTAWLTSVTGVGPEPQGAAGMESGAWVPGPPPTARSCPRSTAPRWRPVPPIRAPALACYGRSPLSSS